MTYEWEKKIKAKKAMQVASVILPDGFSVVGIIVAHNDNGEGAGFAVPKVADVDIWLADVLKDGIADLNERYASSFAKETGAK